MITPLDLNAICERVAVAVGEMSLVLVDALDNLVAEVERLRAESVPCVDCVPRSALVQVGWVRPNEGVVPDCGSVVLPAGRPGTCRSEGAARLRHPRGGTRCLRPTSLLGGRGFGCSHC